jgi:hypothetical protein
MEEPGPSAARLWTSGAFLAGSVRPDQFVAYERHLLAVR